MAQIRQVVSESLQATIRRLLPSQQGFTEDLQATNVITPIIDLTPTAEGSALSSDLASALAFGSQTAFEADNSTVVVVNTAGFYRIFGVATNQTDGTVAVNVRFDMTDGLSTKTIWKATLGNTSTRIGVAVPFDFVVFLAAGESLSAVSSRTGRIIAGSSRQIADVSGNIVNPDGFVSQ